MSYSYNTNEYEFCGFRLPCGICRMTNLECLKLNKPSKPNYTINVTGTTSPNSYVYKQNANVTAPNYTKDITGTTSPNGYVYKQGIKVEDSNND